MPNRKESPSQTSLAHGYTAAHKDGIVKYTAHELRHVCASLLIAGTGIRADARARRCICYQHPARRGYSHQDAQLPPRATRFQKPSAHACGEVYAASQYDRVIRPGRCRSWSE